MTFSLLVLGDQIPGGRTIFNLAALVVFCSILAHGATDTAGAEWMGRHADRVSAADPQPTVVKDGAGATNATVRAGPPATGPGTG
jgi:hypothetical protein